MTEIGEKITVTCACGAKLSAPLSAVGKTAPCPKCKATLTVPQPDEADFGVVPKEYDYSMGKGVRYACIAGVIAAAISTCMAALVGVGIGLTAVGIGFACGLAMMAGTKRRAPEVGIIAAGITAAAILLSKVAIALILGGAPSAEGVGGDAIAQQHAAHDQRVEQLMNEAMPAQANNQEDSAPAGATAAAAPARPLPPVAAEPADPSESVLGILSLVLMFGMWDIILLGLAMAAAYFVSTYNDL